MKFQLNKNRKGGCLFKLLKLAVFAVIIIAVVLYFSVSYIADYALKTVTAGTGIDAGVGSISIGISQQSLDVKNFFISNPPNFKKCNAIAFKNAYVDLDLSVDTVLAKRTIVVDEVSVEGLTLNLDLRMGSGLAAITSMPKSNITDIAEILEKKLGMSSGGASQTAPSESATAPKSASEPFRFIIKKIIFKDGTVSGAFNSKGFEFPLPSFTVENIGVREDGITGGELIVKLTEIIASKVTVDAVKYIGKESLNLTDDAAKAGTEATTDITKDVSGALKSLFN